MNPMKSFPPIISKRSSSNRGRRRPRLAFFTIFAASELFNSLQARGSAINNTDTKSIHNENSTEASLGSSFTLSNNNLVTDKYQESQRNFVSEGCIISLMV